MLAAAVVCCRRRELAGCAVCAFPDAMAGGVSCGHMLARDVARSGFVGSAATFLTLCPAPTPEAVTPVGSAFVSFVVVVTCMASYPLLSEAGK